MKPPFKIPEMNKNNLIKMSIIFFAFMLFVSGAIGLIEISISQYPIININSKIFHQSDTYALALEKIIYTSEFIYLLISGVTLTIALPLLSPIKGSILTFLVIPASMGIGYSNTIGATIPLEYCLLTILIIYVINILISYFIEIHSKQRLIGIFGQYIPPHLVEELSRHPETPSLEGESKILTVFFCDLQDFTSVSEELNPKQLNKLLNEYFTVMTEILFKHEATIDKYIGDAIMAFWNAPLKQEGHAQHAVEAALEMNKAIQNLSRIFITRGWPGPTMGIGINTGRANVGNMGSKYKMTYTAIGDTVNLASRIETLTRIYKIPILVTEDTKKHLQGIYCREIDLVRVRGKHQETRIFEPLCLENEISNSLKEKMTLHSEALKLYYSEKYKDAGHLFKEIYQLDENDKYYKVMFNQCNKLI